MIKPVESVYKSIFNKNKNKNNCDKYKELSKNELIKTISECSSSHINYLLNFMDMYGLSNLADATIQQLQEYYEKIILRNK